jgi:hypothetical protein
MLRLRAVLAASAVIAVWATGATAHPGGLDAQGCHHDRKRGAYHCHGGLAPVRVMQFAGER